MRLTEALGVLEVADAALVAGASGEPLVARTLAIGRTDGRETATAAAVALATRRIAVEAGTALVATRSEVTRLAQTLAAALVADLVHRAARIAFALCRHTIL